VGEFGQGSGALAHWRSTNRALLQHLLLALAASASVRLPQDKIEGQQASHGDGGDAVRDSNRERTWTWLTSILALDAMMT
jgi:hypothetical protein